MSASAQPLLGLRVADFSTVMAGPYCTRVLAGLGAEVVKVEAPVGDVTRGAIPVRDGHSAYFAELNSGKQSLVLDLRRPEAQDAARALIDQSDIVVENMRAGGMAKFGLDYETVSESRPEIVYCSITGFGQDAPDADRPATAQVVHATVGYDLAFCAYQPGAPAPPATGLFVADGMAGALAIGGILAALRGRDLTGIGQHVDVALDRSLLSMLVYEVQAAQFDPGFVRKGYRPVRSRDGYIMVAAVTQRNFLSLCDAIGRPELKEDERFALTANRWRSYNQLHALIEEWSLTRSGEECERRFLEFGVPATRYRTVSEYLADTGTRERLMTAATDGAGELQVTKLPFHLSSGAPDGIPVVVPGLGEHTRAVLTDVLGQDQAETLIASGAAGEHPA